MKSRMFAVAGITLILGAPSIALAGGLRGSATSMKQQHKIAVERDLTFMSDAAEVEKLVHDGGLLTIASNEDYSLAGVSYPYAVPEVKLFVERLGRQYHEALGAPLVVTSLTRPTSQQPRNAHELSVHPAGMAIDFRVPQTSKARAWLESALLQLENAGVIDVTREKFPPHYHVAVFPVAYRQYAEARAAVEKTAPMNEPVVAESIGAQPSAATTVEPVVIKHSSFGAFGLVSLLGTLLALCSTLLVARKQGAVQDPTV